MRRADYFCRMLDITSHSKVEIKETKMSSFSSDFQTLIKHQFPLYFLYELLMSLRKSPESTT